MPRWRRTCLTSSITSIRKSDPADLNLPYIINEFQNIMHIALPLLLLLYLAQADPAICPVSDASNASPIVKLSLLPLKENGNYQYSIYNYPNSAQVVRNDNGTFLLGNFSTLQLFSHRSEYKYVSSSLSFTYPPQHRVAELNNEMLEMQILYELTPNNNPKWKHRRVALSVNFLLTEYAPQRTFTLGEQITPNLQDGDQLDLHKLLPLVAGLKMVLYKGTHTDYPEDDGFMWLVRKELLLMSQMEFEQLKSFIFQHKSKEQLNYHGLLAQKSTLNEISQAGLNPLTSS